MITALMTGLRIELSVDVENIQEFSDSMYYCLNFENQ